MQFRVIDGGIFIETEGQAGAAFRFAASMPALTRLAGPDEIPESPTTPGAGRSAPGNAPRASACADPARGGPSDRVEDC